MRTTPACIVVGRVLLPALAACPHTRNAEEATEKFAHDGDPPRRSAANAGFPYPGTRADWSYNGETRDDRRRGSSRDSEMPRKPSSRGHAVIKKRMEEHREDAARNRTSPALSRRADGKPEQSNNLLDSPLGGRCD